MMYPAALPQSRPTRSDSNDVHPLTPDQHEGENSQKEVLNRKHKAPGIPGLQASNGPN